MVGRDHEVGGGRQAEIVERLAQLRQIVVGVLDTGERSRAVDAGRHGVEAVAGVVLATVGVARPEYQHERLAALPEDWQHDFARDVGEIGLLCGIRHQGAGRLGVAGLAIVAARWRRERKTSLSKRGFHFVRKRNAILAAGGIVDHDRMQAIGANLVSVVENQGRTELTQRRRAVAFRARHLQYGLFIQIIAAEMLIDVQNDGINLEKRRHGTVGVRDGITGIDRVAEIAGIAEVMASRHRRGVGGGEGRKQRVWIFEIDALVADFRHRRRGLGRNLQRP